MAADGVRGAILRRWPVWLLGALLIIGGAVLGTAQRDGLPPAAPATAAETYSYSLALSGPEEDGLPGGEFGMRSLPDGHISFLSANGQYHVWVTGGTHAYLLRGASFDSLRPHRTDARGGAVPVLGPTGEGIDRDYAGFGAVLPGLGEGELYGIYHAEQQCPRGGTTAAIGMAYSRDFGETWERRGTIITGRNLAPPCAKFTGAGEPSAIVVGDYIYLYYVDWGTASGPPDEVHVARARISSGGLPGTWQKYYRGAWSQPGLGGQSTAVIARAAPGATTVYAANPSVSFNTVLGRYLATVESRDGIYYTASEDGVRWETPRMLLSTGERPQRIGYPTLLSPMSGWHAVTAGDGYLYYAKGIGQGQAHRIMRRAVRIVPGAGAQSLAFPGAPADQTLVAGQEHALDTRWSWVCSGDVDVRFADGRHERLFDSDGETGLVVMLDEDSGVFVVAPYGAHCHATEPATEAAATNLKVADLLARGCAHGCRRVLVIRIDRFGVTERRWEPV